MGERGYDAPMTADSFHALHAGPGVLRLANAWDAGSARLIESLGATAIATTSCGVAWAQGWPDGDALPVERLLAVIAGIARVISVPLTADIEGGYSDDLTAAAETVSRVIDAGAVAINIEDGAGTPELLAAKIAAIRGAADRAGVRLFVNARTDVFLRGLAPHDAVGEVVRRAALYRDAGADGLFVPGIAAAADIGAVVAATPLPVNVMALPTLPPLAELEALGVRRLSAGGSIAEAALGTVRQLAAAFLTDGDCSKLRSGDGVSYGEMNALFG